MEIKLIPVIELFRLSDEVKIPTEWPYWEYPDVWEKYRIDSLEANGFSEIKSYAKGSNLYEISKLKETDLLKQIKYWIDGWSLDEICPFDGGYILNVDGEDLLYPQCCGDLGDVENWTKLSKGNKHLSWEGHPWPLITIKKDRILFDLTEPDESFVPIHTKQKYEINISALQSAINNLIIELRTFSLELNRINDKERLGFSDLGRILIWKDLTYR